MPDYNIVGVSGISAVQSWISAHPNVIIESIAQSVTPSGYVDMIFYYNQPTVLSRTSYDRVNTEVNLNSLD